MFRKPSITRRSILAASTALAMPPFIRHATTPAYAAAPLLGATTATHYRFELGRFEITTVLDAGAMINGPWPIVADQVSARIHTDIRQ
jgi:hypothetical protein